MSRRTCDVRAEALGLIPEGGRLAVNVHYRQAVVDGAAVSYREATLGRYWADARPSIARPRALTWTWKV